MPSYVVYNSESSGYRVRTNYMRVFDFYIVLVSELQSQQCAALSAAIIR